MGATRGRESMSSSVQRLVKFVPFIMHLNEFSFDNALLFIVKLWIVFPSIRKGFVRQVCVFHEKAFSIRSLCLLEEGFYVLEVNTFHEKGFCKQSLCLLGEELQYQKFMPSMKRAFIREVEKCIEMCLWVVKQQNFRVREYESGAQKSCSVLYVMVQ